MWPKALTQLIEVLPHVTRLLPVADRFLQSKTSDTEASRTALEQMAEGLRGDLGQVTAAHAGLYRSLNNQSEKLSTLSADLHASEATLQALNLRLIAMEKTLRIVLVAGTVSAVVFTILLLTILLRH